MIRYDLAFSEDGDLIRSVPKTDEEGNLLYKQPDGSITTDKQDDGVFIYDLSLGLGYEAEQTIIKNRIKTENPDWFHHANIGADLSDLIGEPNTRETAERGVGTILRSLTYANLYSEGNIDIKPLPVSDSEIVFFIRIYDGNAVRFYIPLVFNLTTGVSNIYQKDES